MFRSAICLILAGFVALPAFAQGKGYSSLVAKAKTAITRDLKDPESAKFRDIGIYKSATGKGGVSVCGEINAKNSYGAYAGYRGFVANEDLAYVQEDGEGGGNYAFYAPILCHTKVASVK